MSQSAARLVLSSEQRRCRSSPEQLRQCASFAQQGYENDGFGRRQIVPAPADVASVVANRTDDPRRISSEKGIRGNVLGDYRTRSHNRVFAYRHPADNGCSGCDPNVSLDHNGLSDCSGATPRRFKGVVAVIAIARLTFANMAADSGVLR
jgi:hypothetical protein